LAKELMMSKPHILKYPPHT